MLHALQHPCLSSTRPPITLHISLKAMQQLGSGAVEQRRHDSHSTRQKCKAAGHGGSRQAHLLSSWYLSPATLLFMRLLAW